MGKIEKNLSKKLNNSIYDLVYYIKTAPFDALTIFRDNGNGNMDSTKVMVKMLEEKVNKKIEIIENKNKGENIDNNKFNDKIKELEDNLNRINGELNKIKNGNKNIGINLNRR